MIHRCTPLGRAFPRPRSHAGAHCLGKEGTGEEVSRGFAMVGLQQSTETLDANNLTYGAKTHRGVTLATSSC